MGKGLIPADPETWSVRRRQIVPAFHKGKNPKIIDFVSCERKWKNIMPQIVTSMQYNSNQIKQFVFSLA